jgi:hypothetical protein
MRIYVAGKNMERARPVMDALIVDGHEIAYDWITNMPGGPTKDKAIAEWEAVRSSDLLVYLWESDQESARYEAGMAMGLELPIIVSGNSKAFFFQIPKVHCVESDSLILGKVKEIESQS